MSLNNYTQCLIIHFDYSDDDLDPLFELQLRLAKEIEEKKLGVFDGNEIGLTSTDARFYMYSNNVRALFDVIRPILRTAPFMHGASATLRLGSVHEPGPSLEKEV